MGYNGYGKIKSFNEIQSHDFTSQRHGQVKSEIEQKDKSYILGVDEDVFKEYLVEKYKLENLVVNLKSEHFEQPYTSKEVKTDSFYNEKYEVDAYNFTISYNFSGSAELFSIQPPTWSWTSAEIYVDANQNIVSFDFKLFKKDPQEFESEKNAVRRKAFTNIDNANAFVNQYNSGILSFINDTFQSQKAKYLEENNFFAAINVKVNNDTDSVFTAPTIKKRVIPQPPSLNNKKEFASEPTMSKEMYDDVLKVIYDSGKSMEKKPSLYKAKDEEGLRDQFLFVLETRYLGTTASGETFNRGGKTDIILKYSADGSNVFVAECKFWHGATEFQKAISQLFDRYLTWRDSKVSLIIFVNNKDFSNVLDTIKADVKTHPYFISENGFRGESSFSYLFHLPQDASKRVFLEIMAFHYDK